MTQNTWPDPEHLARHWAVTKWKCQHLGSLGTLEDWRKGVRPSGLWRALMCWSGFGEVWIAEDAGVRGCGAPPRQVGLGTWAPKPRRVRTELRLPSGGRCAHCLGIQWRQAKVVSVGCSFEYLQASTTNILERKFSDTPETNKTETIIC